MSNEENIKEQSRVKLQICRVLEIALYDLICSNNLLATDRHDLVKDNKNIMWTTNNSDGINAINEMLDLLKEGE